MQTEKTRKAHRLIKWSQKPDGSNAIREVEEVSCDLEKDCACGGSGCDKRKHSTQTTVNKAIMRRLTRRFQLTQGTFFMKPGNRIKYGLIAETDAARRLLSGEIDLDDIVDDDTREMLRCFEMTAEIRADGQISLHISRKDFQDYWKAMNERTSSSFSELHFGHYKTGARSDYISDVHAALSQLACTTGYSFERWQQGLTVMLEKKVGSIIVDKLRAILLMEADFNMVNKMMVGHRMIRKAEQHGTLPSDNTGGRRGECSADGGQKRVLIWDISRQ